MSEKDSDAVVVEIAAIRPHPDADRLEIAKIFDYDCVVPLGMFSAGQKVAYIPEDCIVSEGTLEKLGLVGKLAGGGHNRTKAQKIRGVLSRGLAYGGEEIKDLAVGTVVNDILGVEKYVVPIPTTMRGETKRHTKFLHYDIENIERFPDSIPEDMPVIITEKIHGSQVQIMWDGSEFAVSSKGLGKQGLALTSGNTIYERAMKKYSDSLNAIRDRMDGKPFIIVGEVFGRGIQNLGYNSELDMRVFEIYSGTASEGEFLVFDRVVEMLDGLALKYVPVLYNGPYSTKRMKELRSGKTTMNDAGHTREGCVIKPSKENLYYKRGQSRLIMKSISRFYLEKKNTNFT